MSLKASFFTAAVIGDVKELKKLLKEINPNFRNEKGETPLHIVAGESHLEAVKLLLDHGADPNAQNKEGETPLHYAAERCEVDVVKLLLQYGADPNARDDNGQTPLHRITDEPITLIFDKPRIYYSKVRSALYFLLGKLGLVNDEGSCVEVIGLLVKHGADINAKDKYGKTPLDYAITYEYVHYIALLAKYGANWIYEERPIDMINCDLLSDELKPADVIRLTELVVGRDALSLLEAAGRGDVEEVKRMLIRVDPNTRDICGRAPLHYAAREGRVEVIKLLLERGAYPNAWDNCDKTPLHYAAERGDVEIVRLLLEKGAYPNARDYRGRTPLHEAAKNGHVDIVRLLLEHGANPNALTFADWGEVTPLYYAAEKGYIEIVRLLVRRGANIGISPLYVATAEGHVHVVKFLLQQVADPSTVVNDLLITASGYGHTEVVKLLLEHGANPNAKDKDGETPLHEAAKNGRVDVVKLLLNHGADPNARDYRGRTPLHYAAEYGYSDIVRLLLEHGTLSLFDAVTKGDVEGVKLWLERGVDPNVNVGGSTPLHVAAERGYVEIVELLLSRKWRVEVDARDGRGFTPLQYACFGLLHAGPVSVGRYRDVVVALLRRGADPDVRDEEGNTVLHWAASRGHGWVVDLLVRYGADLYAKNKRGRTPLDVAVGEAKTVLREWARRFKGEAPPPPRGYIEIEPLDEEDGRGGADRK
jgi:ankyrin repeat protein